MTTQCDRCGCNTGDVLVTIDGVSVIKCTYGCGQVYITIDMDNEIAKQMTLVDVVLLQTEVARLTAELAVAREALGQRDYCNTCGKVQPVAPVYSDDGPYGTYCAICNNSIGSHGDPPF